MHVLSKWNEVSIENMDQHAGSRDRSTFNSGPREVRLRFHSRLDACVRAAHDATNAERQVPCSLQHCDCRHGHTLPRWWVRTAASSMRL